MADSPYLVCLALVSQGGSRSMPLGGRSQQQNMSSGEAPEALAHALALELLLRIWQRSDDGPLQRAAGSEALIVVELQMERLPEDVPRIKADWLNSGTRLLLWLLCNPSACAVGAFPSKNSGQWL